MSLTALQEKIKKHGSSGRYIFLLEEELRKRKTRRKTLLVSLTLNAILLVISSYLMVT